MTDGTYVSRYTGQEIDNRLDKTDNIDNKIDATYIQANTGTGTTNLTTLKVGNTTYSIPQGGGGGGGTTDYNDLSNKPQIGGTTLSGNKTLSDLGIQSALNGTNKLAASYVDGITSTMVSGLSTVATSGSYNDLSNKPTIPTDTNQTIKVSTTTFGANDAISFVAGDGMGITANTSEKTITFTSSGGSSGEPAAYLKSASTSGNTLTLTNKDNTTTTFTPTFTEQYLGTVQSVSVTSGTPLTISGDSTVNPSIGLSENYKIPTTTEWDGKQDALTTQTAYSNKGSATKVPKITTNSLGQVTSISEVTITQPDISGKENTSNKISSWGESPTDTQYPSAALVKTSLDAKEGSISDLATIRSGASAGATALQPSALNSYSTTTQMNDAIAAHHDDTKLDVAGGEVTGNICLSGSTNTSRAINSGTADVNISMLYHNQTTKKLWVGDMQTGSPDVLIGTDESGTIKHKTKSGEYNIYDEDNLVFVASDSNVLQEVEVGANTYTIPQQDTITTSDGLSIADNVIGINVGTGLEVTNNQLTVDTDTIATISYVNTKVATKTHVSIPETSISEFPAKYISIDGAEYVIEGQVPSNCMLTDTDQVITSSKQFKNDGGTLNTIKINNDIGTIEKTTNAIAGSDAILKVDNMSVISANSGMYPKFGNEVAHCVLCTGVAPVIHQVLDGNQYNMIDANMLGNYAQLAQIPAVPANNGTYTLKATYNNGVVIYSWSKDS